MPNNPPQVPQFTGNFQVDAELLVQFLQTLQNYLTIGEPSGSWSTSGNTIRTTLVVGDTLTDTQHTLGTLINVLDSKGLL